MMSLPEAIASAFPAGVYKAVLSNPVDKNAGYQRIELALLDGLYYIEKHTATQVFHEKKSHQDAAELLHSLLAGSYKSFNSWSPDWAYSLQISKKGKILFQRQKHTQAVPAAKTAHNREKNYILKQGTAIPPLVDMGVFSQDGRVINAMYDKYRQINRFLEIVDDAVSQTPQKPLRIVDFGCGKSYLTYVLYHYFTAILGRDITMTGLDLKQAVIEKCNATAQKYGYTKLDFRVGDVSRFDPQEQLDMVITLHACDTATDYALFHAITRNAGMIFSVPCCQHEINGQIQAEGLSLLTRYGLVKERVSSLITDAIRCNLLEHCGYKVQMLEFVSFDHTPKNIMIRAVKRGKPNPKALAEVHAVMEEFHLQPTLYKLLQEAGYIIAAQ